MTEKTAQSEKPTRSKEQVDAMIKKMTKDRIRVFFSTVGVSLIFIIAFGIIGFQLDAAFKTKPLWLFVFLGLSYLVNQIFLAKYAKKFISRK